MPNTEFSLAVPSSEIPEAIANDGYEFDGWYIGDTYIGKTNEEITKYFNQVNSNIVISAHFKQKQTIFYKGIMPSETGFRFSSGL